MKTYLAVASHWSVPGVRQYASPDRAAAERKAAEIVDELIDDFDKYFADDIAASHGTLHAPPKLDGMTSRWQEAIIALQLARLIQYMGGEGEANDALYEFNHGRCQGDPPLIGEGFTLELQDVIADYVKEDDCDPDKIGFPMVWIEEVEQLPADPSADLTLVLNMAERFANEGAIADNFDREAGDPTPADVEAAIARLRAEPPKDAAPIGFALRNGSGAISSLLHQVGQMRGLFTDEDGTIQDAVDAGEAAEIEIENALELLGQAEGVGAGQPSEGALYAAIVEARAGWVARQAPAGQEMNDDRDQEEADSVVDTLDCIVKAAGQPPAKSRIIVVVSGGLVTAIIGDQEREIGLVDYDVDLSDGPFPMLEQDDQGSVKPAFVCSETVQVLPDWLDMVEKAVRDAGPADAE